MRQIREKIRVTNYQCTKVQPVEREQRKQEHKLFKRKNNEENVEIYKPSH